MDRLRALVGHLGGIAESSKPSQVDKAVERVDCIGENENRVVDEENEVRGRKNDTRFAKNPHGILKYRYVREPLKIVFTDATAADERYGGNGLVAILEGELLLPPTKSSTVIIFMHPSGIQNLLPMPNAMARAGLHVVTCSSRYPNNDSCLIMEKVAIDLGQCVSFMKSKYGYSKVVLAGWSGGGSLSSFYQAQAENPTIKTTPAGDVVDLTAAQLQPADGLMILAAHTSRAKIFTEWIDPAVLDENDPSQRDVEFDLFDPKNPNQPPYSKEYIARFRQAQIERNRRITTWVKQKLAEIDAKYASITSGWEQRRRDLPFSVPCTQADIRRVDTTIDPNGREPTPLADLAAENHSPVGLARFTTLRSWLSQWSYDDSNADGPKSLANVSVPILILANGADHLVPMSHPQAMFDAIKHENKTFHVIEGASHYYFGQTEKMAQGVQLCIDWLQKQSLIGPIELA